MNLSISSRTRSSTARRILGDERGLSTVEYTILLVLIAVGGISLWTNFGDALSDHIVDAESQVKEMKASDQ